MSEQTNQQTDFANQWINKQMAIDALGEKPLVWDDLSDFDLGKAAQWSDDVDAIKNLQQNLQQTCNLATDCISRQAAIYIASGYCHPANIAKELAKLPSAQSQRKEGRWIYGEHDVAMCDGYRCDKCGFFVPWDYKYTFIDFINDYHFCPNCGSDMRGEEDETD